MHYILYLGLVGFYTKAVKGCAPSKPTVVHLDGKVIDLCEAAQALGVAVGCALSEAKAVLRETGRMIAYQEEDYTMARDAWLDVCLSYSDGVEFGMPHEAYIDLSGHPDPGDVAHLLIVQLDRRLVAGLAPGKWVARLAAREVCPILPVTNVSEFLSNVPTALLSPVSPEHRQRLEFLGYRWVREVAKAPMGVLTEQFGRDAFLIHESSRGRAHDDVVPNYPNGAISERVSFERPVSDRLVLEEAVTTLTAVLSAELCARDVTAEQIGVYFEQETGFPLALMRKLGKPLQSATPLRVAVHSLWERSGLSFPPIGLRIVLSGIKKAPRGQKSLMGMAGASERLRSCDSAVGCLRAAYGDGVVRKAVEVAVPRRELVLRAWKRATGWR